MVEKILICFGLTVIIGVSIGILFIVWDLVQLIYKDSKEYRERKKRERENA